MKLAIPTITSQRTINAIGAAKPTVRRFLTAAWEFGLLLGAPRARGASHCMPVSDTAGAFEYSDLLGLASNCGCNSALLGCGLPHR